MKIYLTNLRILCIYELFLLPIKHITLVLIANLYVLNPTTSIFEEKLEKKLRNVF